ncbi:MAG TPA: F0F1 ATP synthase subunit A [Flavobacteriales bacterium]|nr:F0F1 ATP synthase subunit A [Flavobacteriales bacterium]
MKLSSSLRAALVLAGAILIGSSFASGDHPQHGTIDHPAASPGTAHEEHGDGHTKKEFNAGELIMEHIGDSHDWHLWGHTHLPLPVILKTPGGWEFFSSGHLMHGEKHTGGHGTYQLSHKNKMQVVGANGEVDEAATAAITDLSLTKNALALLLCVALMCWVFIGMARGYAKRGVSAPKGLASFLEPIVLFVRDDIAKNSIGEKHYRRFTPYLLTLFFFIWFLNLIGLIPLPIPPFGANVTGNIVTPLVLSTITFLIVAMVANKHFWMHILAMPGIPWPVLIILTPIEIMGIFIRPFTLLIRLFANIMAGHIVLLVFFCLIFIFSKNGESLVGGYATSPFALAFTVFINCLELLVAALQAYVFTLLTSIYIGTAVHEPHHAHADHH